MYSSRQQKIINYFESAIKSDSVRHAYIIHSPKGMGKKTVCEKVQMYFACNEGSACSKCNGCKSAISGANPDIIRVSNEDKATYEIEKIRNIIRRLYEKPIVSKHKLVIFENAHLLGEKCQNALLKAIEEPPEYITFIFLCDNLSTILPTILSRVMLIDLTAWTEEELKSCIKLDSSQEFLYGYCMGNIGSLIEMVNDEEFKNIRRLTVSGFVKFLSSSEYGLYEITEEWVKNKEKNRDMINILTLFLRDVFFFKNGQRQLIINKDKMKEIETVSAKITKAQVIKITEAVGRMPSFMSRNENTNMALQTMFTRLKEEIND